MRGAIEARLSEDRAGQIKAVMVVHNETSTGAASDIAAVRRAIDAAGHPALLMVDVVSSLGCIDIRHEAWGVDVAVAGSQKGLMLPPGLGFNAVVGEGPRRGQRRRHAAVLLGLGRHAGGQRQGLFPLHPGHRSAVRPQARRSPC